MKGRAPQFALFGLLATVFGMLAGAVPAVLRLEENLGLGSLFLMRGPREAPAEVVVVGLDKLSSDAFGLPNEPAKWPRTLHAELVERLAAAGAAFFVASDSLLALDRFRGQFPAATALVMITYWTAQTLLARSVGR